MIWHIDKVRIDFSIVLTIQIELFFRNHIIPDVVARAQ